MSVANFARIYSFDFGASEQEFKLFMSPRVFKSHLPLKYLPENFGQKGKVKTAQNMVKLTFN
jgi:hypothetical protein